MKNKACIVVFICIILTTGCIRKTELDELAFFSGVGIDQLEDGTTQLILQVILHRELKVQASSGNLPSNNVVAEGTCVSDADSNFSLQSGRRGLWSHTRAIVIGETLATSGIEDLLDFIARDYEIQGRTYLLVAKGKARTILDAETTNLETIQSFNISDMLEQYKSNGKTFPIDINEYLLRASEDVGTNFLPGIKQLVGDKKTEISGKSTNALELDETAIFKDNKLIGWFDETETTGLLFIHGKLVSTNIKFEYPEKKHLVYITLQKSKSNVTPIYEKNELKKIMINVKAKGTIVQSNPLVDASKPSTLDELGKEAATAIEDTIRKSIEKGQKLRTDVFDFASVVHRSNPKLYEGIKSSWDEIFSALEVEIKVDVTVERSGLVTKSLKE